MTQLAAWLYGLLVFKKIEDFSALSAKSASKWFLNGF